MRCNHELLQGLSLLWWVTPACQPSSDPAGDCFSLAEGRPQAPWRVLFVPPSEDLPFCSYQFSVLGSSLFGSVPRCLIWTLGSGSLTPALPKFKSTAHCPARASDCYALTWNLLWFGLGSQPWSFPYWSCPWPGCPHLSLFGTLVPDIVTWPLYPSVILHWTQDF